MTVAAWADASTSNFVIEMMADAISACVLLYDRDDELIYASTRERALLPVADEMFAPGLRLRDLLGAIYDGGGRDFSDGRDGFPTTREEWITDQVSSLWKERSELVEHRGDRWIRYQKRRMGTGLGICVIQDITEQKMRDHRWRAGRERTEVNEQVLDNLSSAISVKTEDMVYVAANRSFCRLIGKTPDEILGKTPWDLFPEAVAERLEGADRQIIRNGIAITVPEPAFGTYDVTGSSALVHKFRVGSQDRHYVVTCIENVSSLLKDHDSRNAEGARTGNYVPSERVAFQNVDGRKVLVVTAEPDVADKAAHALGALGTETSAVNGPEELELFLTIAAEAGVTVDLVLADSRMSQSCREVTSRLQVPTVILDHLRAEDDLEGYLAAIFGSLDTIGSQPGRQTEPDGWIDVLVAEDNPVNQIVFSQILETLGYSFAIAATGEEVVSLYRERSPRLVLMDITLPGLNGLEAAQMIRS
ncbi:MAG TPA: PAS domain-containing protein, partial [Pseudorhizobium sp.]|nr:PAS domain-containing protein [Pseudorhizobium sp.]